MSYYLARDQYPEVLRETDNYIDFVINPSFYGGTKTREHKFLCVGGPFDGEYWSRTQLAYACPGYFGFNRAQGSKHRVIFAWTKE